MSRYYAKRIVTGILILVMTSLILYGLIRAMPSDFVQNTTAGNTSITAEMKGQMTKGYGLNSSFVSGYIYWASGLMKGDFGTSFLYKIPVIEVIQSGAGVTLFISITALIIQIGIALLISLPAGYDRKRFLSALADWISLLSVSVPVFFLGLLLQKFLAIDAGIFPLQGQVSLKQDYIGIAGFFDFAWHMVLPILTVAISSMGGTIKYMKANVEKISKMEYVLAAKARGAGPNQIIWQEIFPNVKVLLVSLAFRELPLLLTGTLIIEQIFGLNGVGSMAFKALLMGDIPFIMGFAMLIALLIVCFSIVEDLFYHLADPRIRMGGGAIK